jgi:hypothetical protein
MLTAPTDSMHPSQLLQDFDLLFKRRPALFTLDGPLQVRESDVQDRASDQGADDDGAADEHDHFCPPFMATT